MKEFLKQVFTGVDGLASSKRVLMLFIGIAIWAFVHIALIYIIKPFDRDLFNTVVMYDFALICMLGGMNVWERGQKEKPNEIIKTNDPA